MIGFGRRQNNDMQLSENNRHTLLLAIHQSIEEWSTGSANDLFQSSTIDLEYPPNGGFTTEETEALKVLQGNSVFQSAMRKVLASCASGVVFNMLNLIDGTSDPKHGDWDGVSLVDKSEDAADAEFLHDDFFDVYWDWREIRPDKTWCLDTLPD